MAQHRILVLADDLTGALEIGSKFAAAGVAARVKTAPGFSHRDVPGEDEVLVVDSETRHLSCTEAAGRIHQIAHFAHSGGFEIVYKKTDSTLRGNIAAELGALVAAYEGSPLLYVPAYPQMGRTVRNGCLYVDGVPVAETCFAHDALNPVTGSHIPTMLAASGRRVWSGGAGDLAALEPGCVAVCDGETDADVEGAARAFFQLPGFKLAAGPAAFAAHLAQLADLRRRQVPDLPRGASALIVNGSLHKASIEQVERARQEGFAVIDSRAISPPAAGDWAVLDFDGIAGAADVEFGKHAAHAVQRVLTRRCVDLLIIFGGDTAYAIVEALGCPTLYPLREVMEGIPIARIDAKDLDPRFGKRRRDLFVITKAGGFGAPDVLTSIRKLTGGR